MGTGHSWNGTGTASSQNGTGTGRNLSYYSGSSQAPLGRFIPQLPPSMISSAGRLSHAPAPSVPSFQTSQQSHSHSYRRLDPGSSTDSYSTLLPQQQQPWDPPTSGGSRDSATPSSLFSTSLSSYMASSVAMPTDPPPGASIPPPSLPNILSYTYEELSQATERFTQNIVGIGSFGTVYHAMIRGNGPYAVKKLHNVRREGGVCVAVIFSTVEACYCCV